MEFFRINKDIPFMERAVVFNIISLIIFIASIFFIIYKGLQLSIEFTGGAIIDVKYSKPVNLECIRNLLNKKGYDFISTQVQNFGTSHDVRIRFPFKSELKLVDQSNQIMSILKSKNQDIKLQRSEFIGPQVGKDLSINAFFALLCVIICITIYLSFRFEWKYAIAGIIANLHDMVIIIGFFAFFQWEFSISVVAAILAVLGYSVNESVVIFDRIRETFYYEKNMPIISIINRAITSTISRTIITHGSTQMMVLSMFIFGGPSLRYFSLALTIGICFGIYSSVFVASSLLIWLKIKRDDIIKDKSKYSKSSNNSSSNSGAQV